MLAGVETLGPGQRLVIWTQGCTLACPGCVSRDTWSDDAGTLSGVGDLVLRADALVQRSGDRSIDGITISGGEPFQQGSALGALAGALRAWADSRNAASGAKPADLLVYSGYRHETLQQSHPEVLAEFDALIDGRFNVGAPTLEPLRGSANQRLIALSDLGRERFAPMIDQTGHGAPSIQVHVSEDRQVHFVGIPRRGDLDRVRRQAARRGVTLEGVSWRS